MVRQVPPVTMTSRARQSLSVNARRSLRKWGEGAESGQREEVIPAMEFLVTAHTKHRKGKIVLGSFSFFSGVGGLTFGVQTLLSSLFLLYRPHLLLRQSRDGGASQITFKSLGNFIRWGGARVCQRGFKVTK